MNEMRAAVGGREYVGEVSPFKLRFNGKRVASVCRHAKGVVEIAANVPAHMRRRVFRRAITESRARLTRFTD